MNNEQRFRNRQPKRINLPKWFLAGVIIGVILDIATFIVSGWDTEVFVAYPIICGFALIAFRKWIFRTFWM